MGEYVDYRKMSAEELRKYLRELLVFCLEDAKMMPSMARKVLEDAIDEVYIPDPSQDTLV